ncbi:MAG TPA: L,D-transpeptidase family protein [Deltaproteobacteria bacterium]|nr:L,D-transpeptidase family protein [Deltaproteobacteria bacterium]
MSSKKALPRLRRFFVFAALVIISITTFPPVGAGQIQNPQDRPTLWTDTVPAAEPEKARPENDLSEWGSLALWRRYIWQSLPTESLVGPDPDPISEGYQKNDWKPIFIDFRFTLNQGAALLLARLRTLENEAIDPRPFKLDELSQSLDKLDKCRSALQAADPGIKDNRAESFFDAHPSAFASAASANQSSETAPPPGADPEVILEEYEESFRAASEADVRLTTAFFLFAREMNPFLPEEQSLKALSGEIPLSKFFTELEPKTFNYEALRSAYQSYKKLAAQGAQQRVSMPSKARHGESGNHIRDLQKRLQQEDFYSGSITGVYDSETQSAVKQFQAAHLLDPDGTVGKRTQELLNVSFQQKADWIAYAMKAERQSPSRVYSRFVRINIPQFVLEYYKDGQFQEAHKIVVGKEIGEKVKFRGKMVGENQTPTLTSSIEQLILNPRWYVSDRIRLELDAEAKSDPQWFTKHGYVNMSSRYPWGAPRLFQSSGPKNALGRVKFEFPNPYAVYLHDTPLKHLFARSRRDFSHGCIRVDNALELAETLLRDDASPYAEKIKSVLEGSSQLFVKLSKPVPISIEYIPVVTAGSSQIVFAGDLYGILKEDK